VPNLKEFFLEKVSLHSLRQRKTSCETQKKFKRS
jgi:hypothetical protein